MLSRSWSGDHCGWRTGARAERRLSGTCLRSSIPHRALSRTIGGAGAPSSTIAGGVKRSADRDPHFLNEDALETSVAARTNAKAGVLLVSAETGTGLSVDTVQAAKFPIGGPETFA